MSDYSPLTIKRVRSAWITAIRQFALKHGVKLTGRFSRLLTEDFQAVAYFLYAYASKHHEFYTEHQIKRALAKVIEDRSEGRTVVRHLQIANDVGLIHRSPGHKSSPTQVEPLPALYDLYDDFIAASRSNNCPEVDHDPTVQMVMALKEWQAAVQEYLEEKGGAFLSTAVRQWAIENYESDNLRAEYAKEEFLQTRTRLMSAQSAILLQHVKAASEAGIGEDVLAVLFELNSRTLARYSIALHRAGLVCRARGAARNVSTVKTNEDGISILNEFEKRLKSILAPNAIKQPSCTELKGLRQC